MIWEYLTHDDKIDGEMDSGRLTALGGARWELVSVVAWNVDTLIHYFKRAVIDQRKADENAPSDAERLQALWKCYADQDDDVERYDLEYIRKTVDEHVIAPAKADRPEEGAS